MSQPSAACLEYIRKRDELSRLWEARDLNAEETEKADEAIREEMDRIWEQITPADYEFLYGKAPPTE